MKQNKMKKPRTLLMIVLGPALLILLVLGLLLKSSMSSLVRTGDSEIIKNDLYSLRANASAYQVELYDELSEALSKKIEEEEVAALVVKSYIADFYTWTNKKGSYDVGGQEYVMPFGLANFLSKSKDEFYKYVTYYINEYGSENLLEVSSVTARGYSVYDQIEINGKYHAQFYVEATWEYKASTVFETEKFQAKGYFNVIKNEDGRFEIISYYHE